MRRFLLKLIAFISIPAFILAVIAFFYVRKDMYMDFGSYKNYSWKYSYQSLGDISTKKLLQSNIKYNSFIFGSSRTVGLYACYLQTKIPGSQFFHYANWNESIGGIYAKLRLLDSLGYQINNVFIYLDTDYTFDNDGRCNANDHYLLTGENRYTYLFKHYQTFIPPLLNLNKIKILLGYKVTDVFPDWESDLITNDSNRQCTDSIAANYDRDRFTRKDSSIIDSLVKTGFLYKRSKKQQFRANQISMAEKQILLRIKLLLNRHQSKYYVVITPLYDQLKFNNTDMNIIHSIFGEHVYDYSGINSITNDVYNYLDRKHFSPYNSKTIADEILKQNGLN